MVYPSRGRRLWSGEATRISFVDALRELLKLGNGRLVYRVPDGSIFMLEVSDDGRAGCLAESGGRYIRGEECITELARRVLQRRGTIEIVELTRAETTLDFGAEPATLLAKGVEAIKDLIELLAPTLETSPTAAPAPPPAAPSAAPAPLPSPAPPMVEEKLRALRNISEDYNPLSVMAIVARGDRIVFDKPETTCADIAAEILQVPDVRATIFCQSGGEKLTILIEKGGVKPLLEREDGTILLGRDAAMRAAVIPAAKAIVYIVH